MAGGKGTVGKQGDLTNTLVKLGGPATNLVASFFNNTANTDTTFVQFFDVENTSDVTLGTTAPVFSWGIPGEASERGPFPHFFQNGIIIAATTGRADAVAPGSSITYTVSLG